MATQTHMLARPPPAEGWQRRHLSKCVGLYPVACSLPPESCTLSPVFPSLFQVAGNLRDEFCPLRKMSLSRYICARYLRIYLCRSLLAFYRSFILLVMFASSWSRLLPYICYFWTNNPRYEWMHTQAGFAFRWGIKPDKDIDHPAE